MKRLMTTILLAVLAGLFVAAVGMPSPAEAQVISTGGPLSRLAADPLYFGPGEEKSTALEPPGDQIYFKTVFVPPLSNTLFLTISTTGDTHGGAGACFTALLDENFFNPGGQGAAKCANNATTNVPGWVTLLKLPNILAVTTDNCNEGGGGTGDCHDNSIHYEWCTAVTPGFHNVEVRMATSNAGNDVFIEQAFFYVDSAQLFGNVCDPLLPPLPAGAPAVPGAPQLPSLP